MATTAADGVGDLGSAVLSEQAICPSLWAYDTLLSDWIPEMILRYGKLQTDFQDVQYKYHFQNVRVQQRKDDPRTAFLLNRNYLVNVLVDVWVYVATDAGVQDEAVVRDYLLVAVPIPIHSAFCHFRRKLHVHEYDGAMAGTLISHGKPRFVPLKQRLRHNLPFRRVSHANDKVTPMVTVRSEHLKKPHRSTSTLHVQVTPKVLRHPIRGQHVVVSIPFLKPTVPLTVILLALDWSVHDFMVILRTLLVEFAPLHRFRSYLVRFEHTSPCKTKEDAFVYLCKVYEKPSANEKCVASVKNTLRSEVLPHLNDMRNVNAKKGYYLAMVTAELLAFAEGLLPNTDLDACKNLTADDAGTKVAQLFRLKFTRTYMDNAIKTLRRNLKLAFKRASSRDGPPDDFRLDAAVLSAWIPKVFPEDRFSAMMSTSIATGRWSDKQVAVTHQLQMVNLFALYEQTRRISSAFLNNDGKHLDPRMLNANDFGRRCAATTTENEHCGLIGSVALFARLSRENQPELLMEVIRHFVHIHPLPEKPQGRNVGKFLDPYGRWVGWVEDTVMTFHMLRGLRRRLVLPSDTGVWLTLGGRRIVVRCTRGRLQRPLLIVENLARASAIKPGVPFTDQLLTLGMVEYLDAAEEYSDHPETRAYVANHMRDLKAGVTHIELSNASMLGLVAATLAFPRHNQGPRSVYAIGMDKQAIPSMAFVDTGAPSTWLAHNAQRQAVCTRASLDHGLDRVPKGTNCVVAFMPVGYNQEDAIVISRRAVEAGLFSVESIRTYSSESRSGDTTVFERPTEEKTFGLKAGNYSHLGSNGIPTRGQRLRERDVVIAKTVPFQNAPSSNRVNVPDEFRSAVYAERRRDVSVQLRSDEDGGTVHSTFTLDGVCKVRVVKNRAVVNGDKLTNQHGQKGVIGRQEAYQNLPFDPITGETPHLLIGPEGMTSRMTVGMVLEMLFGKAAAVSGLADLGVDDQVFDEKHFQQRIDKVKTVLRRHGLNDNGTQMLVDGVTGKMIECPIMMGVCYYKTLTHKIRNKAHARAEGPKQPLTRQPVEGRRRKGGFRLGAMEIDVLGSHAVTSIMRERAMRASDPFQVYICGKCGFYAEGNIQLRMTYCRACKTSAHVRIVEMPYGSHLLFSELQAQGIKAQFSLNDVEDDAIMLPAAEAPEPWYVAPRPSKRRNLGPVGAADVTAGASGSYASV